MASNSLTPVPSHIDEIYGYECVLTYHISISFESVFIIMKRQMASLMISLTFISSNIHVVNNSK